MAEPVTQLDEAYGHQLVKPRHQAQYEHENWQERCYHLLFTESGLMLDTGRAIWPGISRRRAFAGITDGSSQRSLRTETPFLPGEDPDHPEVDGIRIEATRPLEEIRLSLGERGDPLAFDLTYRARFAPVATTPLLVEQRGEVVTHYMNFFQSGRYDGWICLDGDVHRVEDRLGFRDRGWGLRKHEGAPRRGLVLSLFCELPDEAVYLILFETASGRRVLADGWSITDQGVEPVVEIEHELEFTDNILDGGRVTVSSAGRGTRTIQVNARQHLFLPPMGYSTEREFVEPGSSSFAVDREEVRSRLEGQTDHGCDFEVEGVAGHGYVETGLGAHRRYRAES